MNGEDKESIVSYTYVWIIVGIIKAFKILKKLKCDLCIGNRHF